MRFHDRHESMTRRGRLPVLSLLLFGCSRYEARNELDVPGLCDTPPTTSSGAVAWHRATAPRALNRQMREIMWYRKLEPDAADEESNANASSDHVAYSR